MGDFRDSCPSAKRESNGVSRVELNGGDFVRHVMAGAEGKFSGGSPADAGAQGHDLTHAQAINKGLHRAMLGGEAADFHGGVRAQQGAAPVGGLHHV